MARTTSSTWRTTSGASPREGSSSSSRRGCPIRARPMASSCCCPRRASPPAAGGARRGGGTSPAPLPGCGPRWRRASGANAPSSRFSSTERPPNSRRPSGTSTTPRATTSCGGRPSRGWPSNLIPPLSGRCSPAMARRRVLLPAPVGAHQGHDLARLHPQRDVPQGPRVAVGHRQAVDLKQHAPPPGALPARPGRSASSSSAAPGRRRSPAGRARSPQALPGRAARRR